MEEFAERTKHSLDECRTLILGTQVLAGFLFSASFQKGFALLPTHSQVLDLVALALMLGTFGLLMAPAFYHQIVEGGNDTPSLNEFATTMIECALLPFATALGMALFVVVESLEGWLVGSLLAVTMALAALFAWYGWEMGKNKGRKKIMKTSGPTSIKDKVDHVLTESRIIIPGAQALLGFQFIVFLSEAFKKLPRESQWIHLSSLMLVMASVILLMTPAAYHREVEHGKDTAHFHRIASRFVIIAPLPLALALTGDYFVVARMVFGSVLLPLVGASVIFLFTLTLWFGYPLVARRIR